jgi:hypothetical protein
VGALQLNHGLRGTLAVMAALEGVTPAELEAHLFPQEAAVPDEVILVPLTDTPRKLVENLVQTGLFGESEEEVCRHLILVGLQDAVAKKLVRLETL